MCVCSNVYMYLSSIDVYACVLSSCYNKNKIIILKNTKKKLRQSTCNVSITNKHMNKQKKKFENSGFNFKNSS